MLATPLESRHRALGAKMVPFAGWSMPVVYADITTEHHAVRQRAGLFDLSHMGRVFIRGSDALTLVQRVQTNDAAAMKPGRIRYAMLLNSRGGVEDDILLYREEAGFLLVVNAGNREKDLEIFRGQAAGLSVSIDDASMRLAMIAVQDPRSGDVLAALDLPAADTLGYYTFGDYSSPLGPVHVSRTGYTGEDGFELIVPADAAERWFDRVLEVGPAHGLVPCGLGCRDTLRLEAGMPLHGHEISPEITPLEAGLLFGIKWNHDFVGRDALEAERSRGSTRRLVGLDVEGPRIPREGCPVAADGVVVGDVKSGTRSPTLGINIATALVRAEHATDGSLLAVDIRGHQAGARVRPLPFHRRKD